MMRALGADCGAQRLSATRRLGPEPEVKQSRWIECSTPFGDEAIRTTHREVCSYHRRVVLNAFRRRGD